MTYETINDVPSQIQDFYHVETRSEQNGEVTQEQFTYIDENGDEQTSTRPVPVYIDVDYVVENDRGYQSSIDDLEKVIARHSLNASCGDNTSHKKICDRVTMYLNMLQWNYHDKFVEWLSKEPTQDNENNYQYELNDWQAAEPPRPEQQTCDKFMTDNYQLFRVYPDDSEFKDGWVKNDTEQMESYRVKCLAVKSRFPKEVE